MKDTIDERIARNNLLKKCLKDHVLVLDGGTGTVLQGENLTAKDFGGDEFEGCNENLVLTRPDIVKKVHVNYLQVGADIVETNTFGATPFVLNEYGLGKKTFEINKRAAEIAREACLEFSQTRPRFVAGSIGPTTKAISITGGITFNELASNYYEQVKGLYTGGADYFLIETCNDTMNVKACLEGIDRLHAEVSVPLPVAISGTIEPMGTMLAGQGVDALLTSLEHRDLLYIGLNCATGPEFMTDHIRTLAAMSKFPVACVPNAGLPDENGKYLESPEMVGNVLHRFMEKKWVNVIGGCCGTHAGHIAKMRELADKISPRSVEVKASSRLSGIEFLEITEEMRPVLVGERTNVVGSKKFRELISAEKWEEASEVGRAQVKKGAAIIDVCLASPDRNEIQDMEKFLPELVKKIKVPIMIDSTDHRVIECALKLLQGKAIINSINLEDGEERFAQVLPLVKKYGAAVVVGCIDDDPNQGMGVTRERKLEIADREYNLLTKKYGLAPEDIYWDALVFPCGTGDEQYKGSAPETIEAIRLLKEKFPGTKTILGISNVSFGLPSLGREYLNAVFLYHCVKAGLDLSIVNTEKLPHYFSLSEDEIKICDEILWNRGADPVASFAAFFRDRAAKPKEKAKDIPLDERLANYIIEGSKEGLYADIDLKLKEAKPLEIINGALMKGMDRVGVLFNKNEMIVAEVLQSAEAMKAAVSHLEPLMEKSEDSLRGKMVLATVKGDVHDIGKNLVDIILSNNGFRVINLGIKIPSEQLIAAIREHKPDILGLSGLLVKSALQMETSAQDLLQVGINIPILVGGAALTQNFADRRIAKAYGDGVVAYAKDAMGGLELAKQLTDPDKKKKIVEELKQRQLALGAADEVKQAANQFPQIRSKEISILNTLPKAPDLEKHVLKNTPVEQIWKFVNNVVLYNRHLGLPAEVIKKFEKNEEISTHKDGKKLKELVAIIDSLKVELKAKMKVTAVYSFYKAASENNKLFIFDSAAKSSKEKPIAVFDFPRQQKENGFCISDYALPLGMVDQVGFDSISLFCVSAGAGIRELANDFKNKGEFLKSHAVSAFALETAEAYAEYLHSNLRAQWGFPDGPDMTLMERFQAKYRGCRYSFGYPACPRLDDQEKLFQLLKPQDIGVNLTEGFMMDPEASVSAIVFHHPDAKYFSVGGAE